jgi:type II secretory pathway pseudopilin PulG
MRSTARNEVTGDRTSGLGESRSRGERGDTLIEVLMALVVLSITALAIMIAFSTSISASAEHRDIATAQIVLANYSQQAISQIEQTPSLFTCAYQAPESAPTYVLDNMPSPITTPQNYGGYVGTVSDVEYWSATTDSFQAGCIQNAPLEVTIKVTGTGGPFLNTFVVDLPSGNLGAVNDLSNGIISQLVFTEPVGGGGTGSSGSPFSPQPVVSALDSNNEIVGSSYPAMQYVIESGPSGTSSISGCVANDPNGVATLSGCTITGPAGTYVLHATWSGIDSDPSGIGKNANSFNHSGSDFWQTSPTWYSTTFTVVVAAAKDHVAFATGKSPVAGASGAALTTQPTINIDTTANKVDTTQNGQVTLTLTGGSLTGCASTNGAVTTSTNGETITAPVVAGAVALTGCKFSGAIFYNATASPQGPDATIYGITASFMNAISASSQISVTAAGPATQLVFVIQPSGVSNASATTKWPQPFAVEIEDAFGNPVWTDNATNVTAAFDPTGGSETLKNCSETSVPDSATATFTGCNATAYGGGLKLKASYGNPAITQDSQPFSISASAASLVFSTQPVAGQSGSAFTTQPAVEVLDNLGNVDTGFSGVVALAPSGGSLTGCTGSTPNNGIATFQACLFAGNPGTPYTLTASINSGATTVVSAPFSPSQAGAATQLQFTTQPVAGTVAGSVMATQPVVKIEDSQGNVVTSSSATIALSINPSGDPLPNCANLTAVLGVVNVSNCTFGGLIGSQYTLTAASPGLKSATSLPFASNTAAGLEAAVLISANPTSVPASSVTNAQLSIQVVDNWDNPTVSDGDTVLTMSAKPTTVGFFSATMGTAGTPGASSTVTIPTGDPSATVYYGDEFVGTPTIYAYDAGAAQNFGSTTLNITPGTATQLVYTAPPPTTVTAGTPFSVGVTEEDQFNNVVSTDSASKISLTASNGASNGGFTCTSTSAVVSQGVATFSKCSYASASSKAYVLTASSTGLTSATASTTVSAGPASKVIVWGGNDQSTKISTAFASPLSALVTDASGNPVADVTVTFTSSANGANGKFAGGTGTGTACGAGAGKNSCTAVTNAAGIATSSTFTASATAGTYSTVTAGITGASANFTETNTSAVLVLLTGAQNFATTTTSAGTTSGSFIIQAQDGAGNPVTLTAPLMVTLAYKTLSGTVTLTTDPTTVTIPAGSSNGVFTVVASNATGNPTFSITGTATGYASTGAQTETVKVNAVATATLVVTSPAAVAPGSNAVFPVVITNSTNGTLSYSVDTSVNGLLSTGEGASVPNSSTCVQVARNGKTTIDVTVNTSTNRPSGSYTLDFIVESFAANGCHGGTTSFQVDGTLGITSSAGSMVANGGYGQVTTNGTSFSAPLSVVVTDGNGNLVSGAVVTFSAPTNGAGGTFLALTNGGTCVTTGTAGAVAVASCTATTNASGLASSLTFTANSVTGVFAVQATTPGTPALSFTFEEENQ